MGQDEDLIDSFVAHTANLPSPDHIRLWTGIYLVGAIMEQRCWLETAFGKLHPSIYVVLCAPPGVGKTVMTREAQRLMRQIEDISIAPDRLSKESLLDTLSEAKGTYEYNGELHKYQTLHVVQHELSVLIPKYDAGFMSIITRMWDSADPYEESFRTVGKLSIPSPQLSLCVACTPSFLDEVAPRQAWEQGLMSRMLIAYDTEMRKPNLFRKRRTDAKGWEWLMHQVQAIAALRGEFFVDEGAIAAIEAWYNADMPPVPKDPKLYHYINRRPSHMLKLCMISSMSRSRDLTITLQDFSRAKSWLLDMEASLPALFQQMEAGGDQKILEDLWNHCWDFYLNKDTPVPQSYILRWLNHRVPSTRSPMLLQALVEGGYLKREYAKGEEFSYVPLDVNKEKWN